MLDAQQIWLRGSTYVGFRTSQSPASFLGSEKEGILSEVEVLPCWHSLSAWKTILVPPRGPPPGNWLGGYTYV